MKETKDGHKPSTKTQSAIRSLWFVGRLFHLLFPYLAAVNRSLWLTRRSGSLAARQAWQKRSHISLSCSSLTVVCERQRGEIWGPWDQGHHFFPLFSFPIRRAANRNHAMSRPSPLRSPSQKRGDSLMSSMRSPHGSPSQNAGVNVADSPEERVRDLRRR